MEFNSRKELQSYMNHIVSENQTSVVKVCSQSHSSSTYTPIRYMVDEPLYIIFENGMALVLEYYNVCNIDVEYRELTDEEAEDLYKMYNNDLFNVVYDVYNYEPRRLSKRITLNMEYDTLEKVDVRFFEGDYEKWEDGKIITKEGTEENFGEIVFTMKNGNKIHLMAEDVMMDGYMSVWSSTGYENVRAFNCG